MTNPVDQIDKDDIERAKAAQKYFDDIRRLRRRTATKHRVARLFFYPIFFILINGAFFGLLWITNVLDFFKQIEGVLVPLLGVLVSICYVAFIYIIGKITIRLTDKIGIPWFFGDE